MCTFLALARMCNYGCIWQRILILNLWAVVVAQWVERSLPTSEIRSSNPVIGKFYLLLFALKSCVVKTKTVNEKEAGKGPFKCVFAVVRIAST